MRSVWAGTISFGLVSIPVRLHAATGQRDVAFRQVHADDGGRVSFRRVCEACGREVPYAGVAKGYELPDGRVVALTDAELASLPRERAHRIEVVSFTRAGDIDPLLAGRSYYIAPGDGGTRAYLVFREALARTGKVAVGTVTLRQREWLAQLRARDGLLILQTLLRPGEIADPGLLPGGRADAGAGADAGSFTQDLAVATSLIGAMSERFDPAARPDRYPAELADLARAKAAGRGGPGGTAAGPAGDLADGPDAGGEAWQRDAGDEAGEPGPGPGPGPGRDLTSLLRASLARARSGHPGRQPGPGPITRPEKLARFPLLAG